MSDFIETKEGYHEPHSTKKEILKVAIILTALTGLEFVVAFTMPEYGAWDGFKTASFLFLTVCKAFYIVGYFMHLKHEKLNLAYTILIPLLFVLYFIALLLFEGIKVY